MAWNDSFDAMCAADLASTFIGAEFADSVVITQRDQRPRTIACQVNTATVTITDDANHQKLCSVIHVLATDNATTGINSPQAGDYVTWGNRNWSFMSVKGSDQGGIVAIFEEIIVKQHGINRPKQL